MIKNEKQAFNIPPQLIYNNFKVEMTRRSMYSRLKSIFLFISLLFWGVSLFAQAELSVTATKPSTDASTKEASTDKASDPTKPKKNLKKKGKEKSAAQKTAEIEPKPEEKPIETRSWLTRSQIDLSFGVGMPSANYQGQSTHVSILITHTLSEHWRYGGAFNYLSGTYVDTVTFDTTGYQESRFYKLTTYGLSADLIRDLGTKVFIFGGAGLSLTNSVMSSVTTTAPIASNLSPGPAAWSSPDPMIHAGVRYYYRKPTYGIGGELGYSISSLKPEYGMKDIYAALVITFFEKSKDSDKPIAEVKPEDKSLPPTTPRVETPLMAPAPVPESAGGAAPNPETTTEPVAPEPAPEVNADQKQNSPTGE